MQFQFTPLREGRRAVQKSPRQKEVNFNSRPSARGDPEIHFPDTIELISIHAPPRGATDRRNPQAAQEVFQFTPLREGRPDYRGRPRRRCISIHAPPRGATPNFGLCTSGHLFQFTPLREGRLYRQGADAQSAYFNSRPSARGDGILSGLTTYSRISIHAPPRGATRKNLADEYQRKISIHAPPRGATRLVLRILIAFFISIHAPPRGATIQKLRNAGSQPYFNSRPSARGDRKRYAISANLLFNPYKSAWLNNSATQFVEIILVIFHRIIA